jgi:hypothetical protein
MTSALLEKSGLLLSPVKGILIGSFLLGDLTLSFNLGKDKLYDFCSRYGRISI